MDRHDAQNIYAGTDVKLSINVEPIDGHALESLDFTAEVGCTPWRPVTIHKKDAIKVDADTYIVTADTRKTGVGPLRLRLTVQVPDGDFPDGYRTEVAEIWTDLVVVKRF